MSAAADSDNIVTSPPTPGVNQDELYPRRKLHVPVVLVTLFWVMYLIFGMLDLPMFTRFLARAGALLLLLLAFAIWWLVRGPVRVSYRILVLGWAVAGGIIVTLLMDRTVLPPSIFVLRRVHLWLRRQHLLLCRSRNWQTPVEKRAIWLWAGNFATRPAVIAGNHGRR